MRAFVFMAGATALLAGCNSGGDQQLVENGVRAMLSPQGNVTQVSMTKQQDGGWQGYALVRAADGHEARVNCRSTTSGDLTCSQGIDHQLTDQVIATLREQFTARGLTVVDVQMAKENDDLISGNAVIRDRTGAEQRVHCTAPRDPANGRFGLNCREAGPQTQGTAQGEQPAPAPTDGEQAPAEGGQ